MKTLERESLGIFLDRAGVDTLLETARELDEESPVTWLPPKGFYRAGARGQVSVWCSPEDKPACWDVPIERGRAFVGRLCWEPWEPKQGEAVEVFIEGTPSDLVRERVPERDRYVHRPGCGPERGYHYERLPEATRREVMRWLRGKALALVRLSRKEVGT